MHLFGIFWSSVGSRLDIQVRGAWKQDFSGFSSKTHAIKTSVTTLRQYRSESPEVLNLWLYFSLRKVWMQNPRRPYARPMPYDAPERPPRSFFFEANEDFCQLGPWLLRKEISFATCRTLDQPDPIDWNPIDLTQSDDHWNWSSECSRNWLVNRFINVLSRDSEKGMFRYSSAIFIDSETSRDLL